LPEECLIRRRRSWRDRGVEKRDCKCRVVWGERIRKGSYQKEEEEEGSLRYDTQKRTTKKKEMVMKERK
jgi:hypothetical protein